jgi:DNA-binding NarL/FixJ family response regulator
MSDRGAQRQVRVLVVDDSVPCRRAAADVVRLADGFELTGAACSGAEAVAMAGTLEPDLVLLDVRMEGINGFEASRRIVKQRPGTVVVLISAWAEEALGSGARGCGAVATLHKRDLKPTVLNELWARHGPVAAR